MPLRGTRTTRAIRVMEKSINSQFKQTAPFYNDLNITFHLSLNGIGLIYAIKEH